METIKSDSPYDKVKYKRGQELYFIFNNKILKSKVIKIRLIEENTHRIHDVSTGKTIEHDGVKISYLVEIPIIIENMFNYEWIDQDDVFDNKEWLIEKIV